jgi:S1-C subfamily serine protease
MTRLDAARYQMSTGRLDEAKAILESLADSEDGLSEDAFRLLLKCYARLGLGKEYRDAHRRYGTLFGWVYPDPLSNYVKAVAGSVFMIQTATTSGSGFCVAPGVIVTNRHVVEGAARHQIKVISEDAAYTVGNIETIRNEDLVMLTVNQILKPFRLGENDLLEPGEPIVAIGFPAPVSSRPSENIYVSTGTVNSIRKVPYSSERVIYVSAQVGRGISGGPLVNGLGEAIGIVTMLIGDGFLETQPVALPIQLIMRHLERG